MKLISSKSLLMLSAAALTFLPLSANAYTDAEKKELGEVVREYLLENPTVIFEAVENHNKAMEAKIKDDARDFIKDNYNDLTDSSIPFIGNKDADVTIIEFMDYNCGYCKQALPDIMKTIENDKNVRFVFHEMPVLGPTSQAAAKWALAAHKQDKYFEFHAALMKHRGSKAEKELIKIAEKLDLDVDQMKKDAASDEVSKMVNKSVSLARGLGVNGTPAFIVGTQIFRGYIGHDGLEAAIKAARGEQ